LHAILQKAAVDDALIKPGSLARTISTKIFSLPKFSTRRAARDAFRPSPSLAMTSRTLPAHRDRLQKMPAMTAFPATSISSMILRRRVRRFIEGVARALLS
jgi:hypothetical protein